MTNYEKIKAMSVEEMADFIGNCDCQNCSFYGTCGFPANGVEKCRRGIEIWLKSEVEENMLPEICSCGYLFENDETICPNCGKKVEEDG